jgi:hypothetical protein
VDFGFLLRDEGRGMGDERKRDFGFWILDFGFLLRDEGKKVRQLAE